MTALGGPPARTVGDAGDSGVRRTHPPIVIEPGRRALRRYLRDTWFQRDLVRVLTVRDLKLRYRQTVLGVSWVVLQPLLAAGVLSFVFNRVAKLPTDGVPTIVFAFTGMLGWNAFSNTLLKATNAFLNNSVLVSKIFFPRVILPLSLIGSALVDFAVSFVVLLVLMVTQGVRLQAGLVFVPLWVLAFLVLAEGAGSILGSLAVRYRDIPAATPLLVQLLLFASPVAYSSSAVPERYHTVYFLNPLAGLLDGLRAAALGTPRPSLGVAVYAVVVSVALFVIGMLITERMERKFADVI